MRREQGRLPSSRGEARLKASPWAFHHGPPAKALARNPREEDSLAGALSFATGSVCIPLGLLTLRNRLSSVPAGGSSSSSSSARAEEERRRASSNRPLRDTLSVPLRATSRLLPSGLRNLLVLNPLGFALLPRAPAINSLLPAGLAGPSSSEGESQRPSSMIDARATL